MDYSSTRGKDNNISFVEAMLNGLAKDGGLYVPKKIKKLTNSQLLNLSKFDYKKLAFEITRLFIDTDVINQKDFKKICEKTYSENFGEKIISLDKLEENEFILNLYHGPTFAFKDFALQLLGNLYDYVLKKKKMNLTILGATSGDTGSAAISGCQKAENAKIFILFPYKKVSEIQRKQMTTIKSKNVFNIAVKGNFDDCQKLVKDFFVMNSKSQKYNLAAINSINWVRIMGQIVYYFWSYFRVEKNLAPINYVVPTGNFGNVYAGFFSKCMGLPIKKLVVSSNKNDILTRFFSSGEMKKQKVSQSFSPSMDIQVSSNFERLIFYYTKDSSYTGKLYKELDNNGKFKIYKNVYSKMLRDFCGGCISDAETKKTINHIFKKYDLIIDPHTAVGYAVGKKLLNDNEKRVYLATAHYAKFIETVRDSIKKDLNYPKPLKSILKKKEKFLSIENDIKELERIISDLN